MNAQQNASPSIFASLFGDSVHVYTRAQAIDDGILLNLMQDEMTAVAREHYRHPIACTSAVFEIMQKAVENPRYCNSYAGILHDMLFMSRAYCRKVAASTVIFRVIIAGAGRQRNFDFKLTIHGGDLGEPVITISLPHED